MAERARAREADRPLGRPIGRGGAVDRFIDAVAWSSRVGGVAAAALLLAAVLVICQMVFVRYVLQGSAVWQHEFATFSLIGATFIGAPYVLLTHGHVNVDLVPVYLGPRGRLALAVLAALISLTFCVILAWYGFGFWYQSYIENWHAQTVWRPPLWVPYAAVPLGMGVMSLQYVAEILALVTGRQAPSSGGAEPT
jgi:TRAP-type C4-dicarboxylate transport system permease small subunit